MHDEPLDVTAPGEQSTPMPVSPCGPADEMARWIEAAQGGSHAAFNELFARCRGYLLSVAAAELPASLRKKTRPSSVVQQTMITVQQCFSRFEGRSEQELLAWMRGILLRQIDDLSKFFHRAKRHIGRELSLERDLEGADRAGLEADERLTPGYVLLRDEEAEVLVSAMARLSEDYRRVIVLRNWECLPLEEVGRQLQRSADAARKLWVRAIDALRQELEKSNGRSES
jgi:RNA polymerase sigma-70 factor (ECF subfamily)